MSRLKSRSRSGFAKITDGIGSLWYTALTTIHELRNAILMYSGYMLSALGTMVMYIFLPIVFASARSPEIAGIAIMTLTLLQVFVFGPLAANFVDKYGAKRVFFAHVGFFMLGALLWLGFYMIAHETIQVILVMLMIVAFAAGYASNFISVYTMRTIPSSKSGLAFGILTTFSGIGGFIGTTVQPLILSESLQIIGPLILLVTMIGYGVILYFVKSDIDHGLIEKASRLQKTIKAKLIDTINGYGRIAYRGARFIKRSRHFPLIPMTVSLFKGIYYGSLYFLVPMYLVQHPEFHSSGLEIGIYSLVAICVSIVFGRLADKGRNLRNMSIGRTLILLAMAILANHPHASILILVGAIVGIADSLLYSTSQHILSIYNADHDNDGAYIWARDLVKNIGRMTMPLLRGVLIYNSFDLVFELFSSIVAIVAVVGLLISTYLLYARDYRNRRRRQLIVEEALKNYTIPSESPSTH